MLEEGGEGGGGAGVSSAKRKSIVLKQNCPIIATDTGGREGTGGGPKAGERGAAGRGGARGTQGAEGGAGHDTSSSKWDHTAAPASGTSGALRKGEGSSSSRGGPVHEPSGGGPVARMAAESGRAPKVVLQAGSSSAARRNFRPTTTFCDYL